MRRRGYTPEAVRNFCEQIGVAKSNSEVDIEFLEHCVRDDLKTRTVARNVVFDPIKVVITNYPETESSAPHETAEMENNREMPELGVRSVPFGREIYVDGADFMEEPVKKYFRLFPGNEVRLKGAYFITCNEVVKDEAGRIKELLCTYDPETKSGEGEPTRKVKGTIHWVEAGTAVEIRVRECGYLMKKNEEGGYEFDPASISETVCLAEPSIAEAAPGERFQFFRHGYYVADEKLTEAAEGGAKVFNSIVGLKSSWRPAE
jgi:glutaminyl-tRNA synthetase